MIERLLPLWMAHVILTGRCCCWHPTHVQRSCTSYSNYVSAYPCDFLCTRLQTLEVPWPCIRFESTGNASWVRHMEEFLAAHAFVDVSMTFLSVHAETPKYQLSAHSLLSYETLTRTVWDHMTIGSTPVELLWSIADWYYDFGISLSPPRSVWPSISHSV